MHAFRLGLVVAVAAAATLLLAMATSSTGFGPVCGVLSFLAGGVLAGALAQLRDGDAIVDEMSFSFLKLRKELAEANREVERMTVALEEGYNLDE